MLRTLGIFFLAGLCEIGGGYLIWLWLKNDKPLWYGILGAVIIVLYGVVATLQQTSFGRVYACYGAIFIFLSLLWAWKIDNFKPDIYDLVGASLAIAGALVMFFAPRQ